MGICSWLVLYPTSRPTPIQPSSTTAAVLTGCELHLGGGRGVDGSQGGLLKVSSREHGQPSLLPTLGLISLKSLPQSSWWWCSCWVPSFCHSSWWIMGTCIGAPSPMTSPSRSIIKGCFIWLWSFSCAKLPGFRVRRHTRRIAASMSSWIHLG